MRDWEKLAKITYYKFKTLSEEFYKVQNLHETLSEVINFHRTQLKKFENTVLQMSHTIFFWKLVMVNNDIDWDRPKLNIT